MKWCSLTWTACRICHTWTACRPASGPGGFVRGVWDRPNGNGNFDRTGRTGTVSRRRRRRRGRAPVVRCAAGPCVVPAATWTGNPPGIWHTGSGTGWPPRRWSSRMGRSALVVGAPSTATRTFLCTHATHNIICTLLSSAVSCYQSQYVNAKKEFEGGRGQYGWRELRFFGRRHRLFWR